MNEEKETATPSQTVVTNTVPVPVVISSPAVKVRQRVAAPLPRQIIQGDRRFDTETYCRKVRLRRENEDLGVAETSCNMGLAALPQTIFSPY